MRERIEDLGRIAVLAGQIYDHDVFTENRPCRNKDYVDWFNEQTEDKREDIIHNWVYQLDAARDKIYEILEIAQGEDILNRREDD